MWEPLSVDGGKFATRVWREGSGPPLLYLHGLDGVPSEEPFLRELATARTVIAPEHLGFGESVGLDTIDDILDITLYHRSVIDALGLDTVDVLGHSLGGMFAAELAAISPSTVGRLILVDALGLWRDDHEVPDIFVLSPRRQAGLLWHDPESEVASTVRGPQGVDGALQRNANLGAATKFLWPIPDRGLHKRLGHIAAPTLLIWGESDGWVVPAYGEMFAAGIPNARLEIVRGAGHNPMLEQRQAFLSAVDEFLGA